MNIISFSWTKDSFLANRKTKTRREWSDDYARKFHVYDCCRAYDKQPRFGGQQIGMIQVRSLAYEDISTMANSDYEFEGFAYLEERGLKIWGKEPRRAFEDWRKKGGWYWVLGFKKLNVLDVL